MTTPQQNVEGEMVDFVVGQGPSNAYCRLTVDLGPLRGHIAVSARQARAFAIAVLTDQGPHLAYQPPNKDMREVPSVMAFGPQQRDGEPRWKQRQQVEKCARVIAELIADYGAETFGWALQSETKA